MRLELTGKTDLAVRALLVLEAQGPESVCKGADLSESLDTTINYIPQVMAPLLQEGWVVSSPGPTGGYRLTANLEQVSLLNVIEAVEGEVEDGKCVTTGAPCPDQGLCAMHEPWTRARESLLLELESTPSAQVRALVSVKDCNNAS